MQARWKNPVFSRGEAARKGFFHGLLAAMASVPTSAAPAPTAEASVEVGAGHDDNMFLATAPIASQPLLRLGGWFAGVSPTLTGGLRFGGARIEGSYSGDYRQADAVGPMLYHEAALTALTPALGPMRFHVGAAAGRFDASRFPDDRFLFTGAEAGTRLLLGESGRLFVRYRAEWRWLGGQTSSADLFHAVEARLPFRATSRLEFGPRASWVSASPEVENGGVDFRRLRGGLEGALQAGPVSLSAGAWFGTLALGAASERHAGGHLALRCTIGRYLALLAGFDLTAPISAGASRDYARQVFSLGAAAAVATAPTAGPGPTEIEQRPLVQPGRVRFRLRAGAGLAVTVVGSWDTWQAPGRALPATRDPGLYELWMELPQGSYRYHFMVEGRAQRPPEAPRYAADGFGSEDGVIDVP